MRRTGEGNSEKLLNPNDSRVNEDKLDSSVGKL